MSASYSVNSKMFKLNLSTQEMAFFTTKCEEHVKEVRDALNNCSDEHIKSLLRANLQEWATLSKSLIDAQVGSRQQKPKKPLGRRKANKPFGHWTAAEVKAYLGREPLVHERCTAEWVESARDVSLDTAQKRHEFELSMRNVECPEV